MITRRVFFGGYATTSAVALFAITSADRVAAAEQGAVLAVLTAMADASYVNPAYDQANLLYEDTAVRSRYGAEAGRATAQNDYGVALITGRGIEKNPLEGVAMLNMSAEQGFGIAQYNLGVVYRFGLGVDKDYDLARQWFLKSIAQYQSTVPLAYMYVKGEGVAQDYLTSAHLFVREGEKGHYVAAFQAGLMYAIGRGVVQNYQWAWFFLRVADRDGSLGEATRARVMIEPLMSENQRAKAKRLFSGRFP